MNGFFLIDKKENWTSRDVVTKLSHIFHIKKIGHAGTLDPFATGLLLVAVNQATKAINFIEDYDKEYIATIKLGNKTDTGDKTGKTILEKDIPSITIEDIKKVLDSFLGPQLQTPPKYSAVHVNGVKAYKLMYRNEEISEGAIKPKEINVKNIELLSFNHQDEITFKATVSKGTYLRVLGEDIAERLNTVGHLISLRRTKMGKLDVINAKDVLLVKEDDVIPISEILADEFTLKVDDEMAIKIKNGVSCNKINAPSNRILFIDKNNNALAIYERIDNRYICKRGLW